LRRLAGVSGGERAARPEREPAAEILSAEILSAGEVPRLRRRDSLDQVFLLGLALSANGEGIEHA
jgi:hypothetical protein